MAEFPALPLWTDAYLGDTTHLTTHEHGAYLLLLIISWRTPECRLPDDDVMLARYTRMTVDKWRKTKPKLLPFFLIQDGFWHQRRLQDELRHLRSRRAQQSAAGNASVAAKALKRQGRDSTSVAVPLQRIGNEPATPIPTPITLPSGKAADAAPADPVKALFDAGVALLVDGGKTAPQARALIGKWRKENGDRWTREAIASAAGKTDPAAWIGGLKRSATADVDEARAASAATAERYRRMAIPGPPVEPALVGDDRKGRNDD